MSGLFNRKEKIVISILGGVVVLVGALSIYATLGLMVYGTALISNHIDPELCDPAPFLDRMYFDMPSKICKKQ